MERVLAYELARYIDQKVKLRGWVHALRPFGKLNFIILRDRTGLSQILIEEKESFKKIAHIQVGTVLSVIGKVVKSEQAELGYEIVDPLIEIESLVKDPLPIEYNKPEMNVDLEFILDHRPIALRNRKLQAVFGIQAAIAHAFRLYMHDIVRATEYFAPNIIGASSEGGAEFFNVDYFGYTATLAQSSQLYKQMMVGVNERVYALMPFFRAEKSTTSRHLAEGKQFEFEMGFFDHWHEILDVQEYCIKYIVNYLHEHCAADIAALGGQIIKAPEEVSFPRLTFAEAQELFFQRTGIDERQEPDLSPAAERELCRYSSEQFGTDLLFVTDWKIEKRPFYSCPNSEHPSLTNTFDLLCNGTEITSGGERRHTYESMLEGLALKGMSPDNFTDYLSIFKYGMPPHGGFGMGLERLTMTMLKLKNIREASLFPSDTKRIAGNRIKAKIFYGGENIRGEILHLLKNAEMEFQHLLHEPTPTSEDSARVRASKLEEGVKSIILRGKQTKKNFQVNILAHQKLDMKAVAEIIGEKCEFEDPLVIKERFGLEIGGVPPFGPLLNLETFYDEGITLSETVAFNCGLPVESIVMKGQNLITLVQPKIGKFSKN